LALREPVEKEIQRLVSQGTIVRVENSDYGTPIVPVIKKCGSIRICGDYKVTINPKLKREPYPLPRIEELYSILSGGIFFSKIDLAHAYEQVILTEDSRPCTAISTHVGTFQYIRTPYGLSCIPEKFQKMMEEVVRGVPNTVVFLDDICVAGADFKSHLRNLREVFQRLQKVGLRIKFEKCEFFKSGVCYLGHIIDRDGLRPDPKKIRAIAESPRPTDVQQLKALV
ncbi:jg1130, partial [Pararge aegeria aegeria]